MAVLYKSDVEMSDFTVPFVKNRFEKSVSIFSVAVVWVVDVAAVNVVRDDSW